MHSTTFFGGSADLEDRANRLAERLTDGLRPLARVAYNYRWSWAPDGAALFRDINPHRWALSGENPVRFLGDLWPVTQEAASATRLLLERIDAPPRTSTPTSRGPSGRGRASTGPSRSCAPSSASTRRCPLYSGGLGVLAGDILKEASDQALPMVGVGLLYRRGYFRQRLDLGGRQQEYWIANDPKSLPMARVTGRDGTPLRLSVHARSARELVVPGLARRRRPRPAAPARRRGARERPRPALDDGAALRGATAPIRLAQYGLLGIGGARVLRGARDRAGGDPPQRGPSRARRARARRPGGRGAACRSTTRSPRCASASSSRRTRPVPAGQRDLRARTSCSPPTATCPAGSGSDERRVPRSVPRRPGRRRTSARA